MGGPATPASSRATVGDGNAFGEAILHFAKAYAQQTTLDWKALLATI